MAVVGLVHDNIAHITLKRLSGSCESTDTCDDGQSKRSKLADDCVNSQSEGQSSHFLQYHGLRRAQHPATVKGSNTWARVARIAWLSQYPLSLAH